MKKITLHYRHLLLQKNHFKDLLNVPTSGKIIKRAEQ